MKRAGPFFSPLILGIPFILGLIPQSADLPLILAPFLLLSVTLILSNRLVKLSSTDPLLLMLLALWLVWGISGILSPVPFPSKVTWLIFAALPLSYITTVTTRTNLTAPLVITSGMLALYTLWQLGKGTNRPDFPFEDANLLAILMAFATLVAFKNKMTLYAIPLFLAALIATESRTAFLALIAGLGVYFILSPAHWEKSKRFSLIVGTLSMTALVGVMAFLTGFENRIAQTIDQSAGRLALWSAAWDMSWINPLTGLGLGTFHLQYPPFRLEGDNSLGYMTHMDPLQMAVESGWIAAILLYGTFILAGWLVFRNKTRNALPAALLTILFVSMHLTYPLHVVAFLVVMGFALGLIRANNHAPHTEPHKTSLLFSGSLLLSLLLCVYISLSSLFTFLIWGEVKKASHLHDQTRFDAALHACLEDADPDFPDCRMMAVRFMFMTPQKDLSGASVLLDQAEHSNPLNAEIPFLHAQYLFLKHPEKLTEIQSLLDKSLSLNPAFWPARKLSITLDIAAGHKDLAQKKLEKGLIYPYPKATRNDIDAMRKRLDASY